MVYDFSPVPGHDEVLGGFASMKVDGVAHDVFVLGTGLLLIPDSDDFGPSIPRLNHLLRSTPLADLVRSHWFIGYGEITRAKIVKNIPIRVELELAGGRQVLLAAGWTTPLLTKQSDKALIELLTTRPMTPSPPSSPPSHPAGPPGEPPRPAGPPGGSAAPAVGLAVGPTAGPTAGPAAGPAAGPLAGQTPVGAGRLYRDGCDINTATVLDAVPNLMVNGVPYDLVILDIGLVLIAEPGPAEHGKDRIARLIRGVPAYAIASWNWMIGYHQVTQARITKNIPLRAELDLYDGRHLDLKEPWTTSVTDDARTTLAQALISVGATSL